MERFESILKKIIFIQLIFLLISQFLILHTSFAPYFSQLILYEGVKKQTKTETIETIYQ